MEAIWNLHSAEPEWHSIQKGASRAWFQEHGSPAGSMTWLMLPSLGHPVLPRSPLLQSPKIISKVCQGKARWEWGEGGGAQMMWGGTGAMMGEILNHLWFYAKTHYINYPHQNHAGLICPYLQVIFRVLFAVIVRTSFWILRVGWSREIDKPVNNNDKHV